MLVLSTFAFSADLLIQMCIGQERRFLISHQNVRRNDYLRSRHILENISKWTLTTLTITFFITNQLGIGVRKIEELSSSKAGGVIILSTTKTPATCQRWLKKHKNKKKSISISRGRGSECDISQIFFSVSGAVHGSGGSMRGCTLWIVV